MRGKLDQIDSFGGAFGLIPACAGKTDDPSRGALNSGAHPRVCGENVVFSFLGSPPTGSSPRVRGKLIDIVDRETARGLIPACAGKTLNDLEF